MFVGEGFADHGMMMSKRASVTQSVQARTAARCQQIRSCEWLNMQIPESMNCPLCVCVCVCVRMCSRVPVTSHFNSASASQKQLPTV